MEPVDVALCLAIDVSASVDFDEFALMAGGTAAAFRDPAVVAAATSGPRRAAAVAVLTWSGVGAQDVVLGWTRLDGEESAARIAALRAEAQRQGVQLDIEVDGGINRATIAEVVAAGANVIVAGSAILNATNWAQAIVALREAAR